MGTVGVVVGVRVEELKVIAYSYLRFSSSEQGKGDSVRRQIEARDAWLAKRSIPLDTSLALVDRGISGYRSKNLTDGALGMFVDAVRSGQVKKGSYLILENLDRLSRDDITSTLPLFLELIKSKITIVTLSPEQEFSAANLDLTRLIIALIELSRGNSESAIKGHRSAANWEKKRREVATKLLIKTVPSWIEVVYKEGTQCLELNAAKAATIRRIFDLCIGGYGTLAIAGILNREKIPTVSYKVTKMWYDGYVYKILRNRSCIGEFQPMKLRDDGVKGEAGPAIKGYFPAVVSEDIFYRAQKAMTVRKVVGSGRSGVTGGDCKNLFGGIVEDPSGITYTYRGRNYHGYLMLKTGRSGMMATNNHAIAYAAFERMMLLWLYDLPLGEGIGNSVEALEAKKVDIERRIEVIKRKIKEKGLESLFDILGELEVELKSVAKQVEEARIPRYNVVSTMQHLIQRLQSGEDTADLRRSVRQSIKMVVRRIVVLKIEGELRKPGKVYHIRIDFHVGPARDFWFETARVKNSVQIIGEGGIIKREDATLWVDARRT